MQHLFDYSCSAAPGAAQLNMPAATEVSSQPALSSQGSAPGVQLSLSRQASLCNRIAELQAKLTREEAQEPNNSHASALLNSSGASDVQACRHLIVHPNFSFCWLCPEDTGLYILPGLR